jgi:hypothetical protein
MECSERDRLKEVLRVAAHELEWVHDLRERIATERPSELAQYDEVIDLGKRRERGSAAALQEHVEEHRCGSTVLGA